jgi:hypothetical protein
MVACLIRGWQPCLASDLPVHLYDKFNCISCSLEGGTEGDAHDWMRAADRLSVEIESFGLHATAVFVSPPSLPLGPTGREQSMSIGIFDRQQGINGKGATSD